MLINELTLAALIKTTVFCVHLWTKNHDSNKDRCKTGGTKQVVVTLQCVKPLRLSRTWQAKVFCSPCPCSPSGEERAADSASRWRPAVADSRRPPGGDGWAEERAGSHEAAHESDLAQSVATVRSELRGTIRAQPRDPQSEIKITLNILNTVRAPKIQYGATKCGESPPIYKRGQMLKISLLDLLVPCESIDQSQSVPEWHMLIVTQLLCRSPWWKNWSSGSRLCPRGFQLNADCLKSGARTLTTWRKRWRLLIPVFSYPNYLSGLRHLGVACDYDMPS